MRLATSSCSQGDASGAVRCQRLTARGSSVGGRWVEVMKQTNQKGQKCRAAARSGENDTANGKQRKHAAEYIDTVFTRLLSPSPLLRRLPGLVSQCAVCRTWPAQAVCTPCLARFAAPVPRCTGCALALPADLSMGLRTGPGLCTACLREPPLLHKTLAAVPYAYPWSSLVTHYKFGGQHGWAGFFAGLMLTAPGVAEALGELDTHDWVLPVPLSAERLQTRGFNQAWELAHALARQSQTRAQTDARLLLRIRHTRPQSQLRREARLANVKGAFQVEPLRFADLGGRRVLLVDDVMTSGASLLTAAQALQAAGAAQVTAVVLARTQ